MNSSATETALIGCILRAYSTGRNEFERVRDLLGDAPCVGSEAVALYQAFIDYDIPLGRPVGPATWAKISNLSVEVVAQIMTSVPSSAFLEEAVRDVAEELASRSAREIGSSLSFAGDESADTLVDTALVQLEAVRDRLLTARGQGGEKTAAEHYAEYLKDKKDASKQRTISSHIPALNRALPRGGIRPGQLIVIAGRPGMGKSALAMGWGEHAAQLGRVLIYSLEMSKEEFFERYELSGKSGEDGMAYYRGRDIQIIDDLRDTSMEGIVRDSRRRTMMARERGIEVDVIAIDHLGLISPSQHLRNRSRENEVAHITRESKRLAKSLRVPVILLSQLNRQVENREDKAPRLSDLRDSGSIEQDADIVMGLYRPVYYDASAASLPDEIRLLKVRQGQVQSISARFTPDQCRWGGFVSIPKEFTGVY